MNLLEFWNFGYKKFFYAQIPIMIFVMFLLLAMRLNFFMDVVTALAFGYIVYSLIYSKKEPIDAFLLNPKEKFTAWIRKNEDESSPNNQNWSLDHILIFSINR